MGIKVELKKILAVYLETKLVPVSNVQIKMRLINFKGYSRRLAHKSMTLFPSDKPPFTFYTFGFTDLVIT
jgi:hypothetical protein